MAGFASLIPSIFKITNCIHKGLAKSQGTLEALAVTCIVCMHHPAISQPTILGPTAVLYKPPMKEQIRQGGHAEGGTCPSIGELVHGVLFLQRVYY
jgi:hypothetical protein